MGVMLHRLGTLSGTIDEAMMVESSHEYCELPIVAGEVSAKEGEAISYMGG